MPSHYCADTLFLTVQRKYPSRVLPANLHPAILLPSLNVCYKTCPALLTRALPFPNFIFTEPPELFFVTRLNNWI